eukprot:scaffold61893_cov51-Phaeocystis_antarctica.AAC.9
MRELCYVSYVPRQERAPAAQISACRIASPSWQQPWRPPMSVRRTPTAVRSAAWSSSPRCCPSSSSARPRATGARAGTRRTPPPPPPPPPPCRHHHRRPRPPPTTPPPATCRLLSRRRAHLLRCLLGGAARAGRLPLRRRGRAAAQGAQPLHRQP